MFLWKRFLLASAGVGAGFALMASLVVGIYVWHESQPDPWNASAITATFQAADIQQSTDPESLTVEEFQKRYPNAIKALPEGFVLDTPKRASLVFHFVLVNNTDLDYRIENGFEVMLMARHSDSKALIFPEGQIKPHLPLFLPERERVGFSITLPAYRYVGDPIPMEASQKERRRMVTDYVRQFRNLEEFVLFDESKRYRINLPIGR